MPGGSEQICILSHAVRIYDKGYFLILLSNVNHLFIHHSDL